ncbi:MAG: hypothetical protein QF619_07200 [Candidatus Binatia bacterium]|jgi:hypothetical protein|nr:hypothetical protein [Candidatus Binatia bacterium]
MAKVEALDRITVWSQATRDKVANLGIAPADEVMRAAERAGELTASGQNWIFRKRADLLFRSGWKKFFWK